MKSIKYILIAVVLTVCPALFSMGVWEGKPSASSSAAKVTTSAATQAYKNRNAQEFKKFFNEADAETRKSILNQISVFPMDKTANAAYNDFFQSILPLFSDEDIRYLLSVTAKLGYEGKRKILADYLSVLEKKKTQESKYATELQRLQEGIH